MTKPKKQLSPAEIKENAERKFYEYMSKYHDHSSQRISAAESMMKDYKALVSDISIEALETKVALTTFACLLHPHFSGYREPMARSIARFESNLRKTLIDKIDDYLQDFPVDKQIAEYDTPFYKQFIANDAIYLEIEKVDGEKAKARAATVEDKNPAVLVSRFASSEQLVDAVTKWRDNAFATEPNKRKKQAAETKAEVEARKSLPKGEKLDEFSVLMLEATAAYLDNENVSYTQDVITHLTTISKMKKKPFSEDQVASLVEKIDFMRSRVIPGRPFSEEAGNMITLLQPSQ